MEALTKQFLKDMAVNFGVMLLQLCLIHVNGVTAQDKGVMTLCWVSWMLGDWYYWKRVRILTQQVTTLTDQKDQLEEALVEEGYEVDWVESKRVLRVIQGGKNEQG